MKKRVCILTKSYKHGGYCVAGIDIDSKRYVRLVNSEDPSNDEIGKGQMYISGKPIECLDIIECEFIKSVPLFCQTENCLLDRSVKLKYVSSYSERELAALISVESDDLFLYSLSNSLSADEIAMVDRSLFVYLVNNITIESTTYESYGEVKHRNKCSFYYNGIKYNNISLTDPNFRDSTQNGLQLSDALIVASLPSSPYNDGLFYKFVAKIIPIDEDLAFYIKNKDSEEAPTLIIDDEVTESPFLSMDLAIDAKQTPGVVLFENYDAIKRSILNGVTYYSDFEYSLENYSIALEHYHELKYVKRELEKAKREIVKSYDQPLEIVEARLTELIDLIKVPFKKVETFVKQNEKDAKKREIYAYANKQALLKGLNEHAEFVVKSPAFFETKWLNASCAKRTWQNEVSAKLDRAVHNIFILVSRSDGNFSSLLAHYYQTLSMKRVEEFEYSLKAASDLSRSVITDNAENREERVSIVEENNNASVNSYENQTLTQSLFVSKNILDDSEIINHVADSVNPITGEVISGIDDQLKRSLKSIAKKLKDDF